MAKQKKGLTVKMQLWKHCISCGWRPDLTNTLHKTVGPKATRMRLNFRENGIVRLEAKRALTEEEIAERKNDCKTNIWETLQVAEYNKVEAVPKGISFPVKPNKPAAGRKRSKPAVAN